MIPIPAIFYRLLAYAAALVIAFSAGYGLRWMGEAARMEKALRLSQELSAEDYRLHKKAAERGATITQEKVDRVNQNFQQINTELHVIETHEVVRNVCLDDDARRLWDGANQGDGHVSVQRQPVDAAVPGEPGGAPHGQ